MTIEEAKEYFESETRGLEIARIELEDTKYSYFDTIECFRIDTVQDHVLYIFSGDRTLTNIYPARPGETLEECYYKHVGLMAELTSDVVDGNFILNFIDDFSVFPILYRRMSEIKEEISPEKNSNQLKGIANQIRDCYITLTDYLMNKNRTRNLAFKNNDFKTNLREFLSIVMPGEESERRRNAINGIAEKGWMLNSEFVHKSGITVFDILISFNILQVIISAVCNIVTGNDMPINKIKCPYCQGEKYIMKQDSDCSAYKYICEDCGREFSVDLDELIRKT